MTWRNPRNVAELFGHGFWWAADDEFRVVWPRDQMAEGTCPNELPGFQLSKLQSVIPEPYYRGLHDHRYYLGGGGFLLTVIVFGGLLNTVVV